MHIYVYAPRASKAMRRVIFFRDVMAGYFLSSSCSASVLVSVCARDLTKRRRWEVVGISDFVFLSDARAVYPVCCRLNIFTFWGALLLLCCFEE